MSFLALFGEEPLCHGALRGLERLFDLLAAHLEQCEIRPVSIPVETFGNFGQRSGRGHNASNCTGLLFWVIRLKEEELKQS